MSNLARLFGAPKRQRRAQPHDGWTKAQLWAELERLRAQLRGANRMATVAAHSIQLLGTEGTPAYRQLADAQQTLREVRALTEDTTPPGSPRE